MAVDRKISDLNPYPGDGKPQGSDLFISAREDNANFKIPFSGLSRFGAEFARSVFTTGDQTIDGVKTFNEFILGDVSGNLSGTAKYVEHGVYITGDQTIDGAKNFLVPITGNLSGTAQFVRDGVYVTGDQTINGIKTFNEFILGDVSGNLSGTARYVQDGVYITGDQLISGLKDFDETPTVLGVPLLLSGGAVDLIHLHGKNHENIKVKKGTPVYISGAAGNNPLLAIAKNSQERTSSKTIGLLAQDLNVNEHGFVVSEGLLEGIDTSNATDGDPMWLGPTGEIIYGISNKPFGANHLVYLGVVLRSQKNNGKVYVKVQNGFEIDELHEVYAKNPEDKDTLLYYQASGYWFSRQLTAGDVSGINSYVENFTGIVRTTGNQSISGIKTFDTFIVGNVSGNLSGTAKYVEHGVYTTGDQTITGEKNFVGGLFLSGSPVLTQETFGSSIENIVYTTGSQLISGQKTFHDEIIPTGGIISANNKPLKFSDGRNIDLFDNPGNSLSLIFESGVYITGGVGGNLADLHVEGSIFANQIDALSEIVGESGSMVFTDGRDPALFEGPDNSLTMAFENGVYITGGVGGQLADLHVEGTIFATQIDALNEIVGESGSMVFTDGRDPALFEGPDNSLSMAFENGVYITGGVGGQLADLHVEGTVFATQIDALNEIVGESGSMVFTDGRDPALFEGPDNSLSLAFSSGVYITGQDPSEANLYVQGSGAFKTLYAEEIKTDVFSVRTINETIKKQTAYIHTHFTNDLGAGTNFYLPLHPGEGTVKENNQPFVTQGHTLLCPHSGRLKKIMMRARGGTQDPGQVNMFICTGNNDVVANSDVFDVEEVEIVGTDRVNTYSFEFTGSNHFVEGNVILLKSRFERSTNTSVNITAEIEYTFLND